MNARHMDAASQRSVLALVLALTMAVPTSTAAARPLPAKTSAPAPAKTSTSTPRPEVAALPAMLGAAVTAADEERYCDALYLFEALHLRTPTPRALYNAAEVAYAAGDRVRALDLYRLTQQRYPGFEKGKLVQARADRVFTDMVRLGPGTACPVRADVCGDWRFVAVASGGEQCDDGNLVDGDGCDSTCTLTACGNGIKTSGEQCDDGNGVDGDGCDGNCTVSACGNGVRTANEQCDDGNVVDGDGCDHICRPTGCGNGVQTANEECDDGNVIDGDGCDAGCRLSRCGNAVVTGLEQCDDGNAVGGDGCENNCTRTQVHKPVPGIIVSTVSAVGLVGGGLLLLVGLDSVGRAESANAALADRQSLYANESEASLDEIDAARATAAAATAEATSIGVPMLVGGTVLAGAGVLGLAFGVWFAITNTDVDGDADGGAR